MLSFKKIVLVVLAALFLGGLAGGTHVLILCVLGFSFTVLLISTMEDTGRRYRHEQNLLQQYARESLARHAAPPLFVVIVVDAEGRIRNTR